MVSVLKRKVNNSKGITLVELLAVLVILAIIALIAVPAITGVINDSRANSLKSSAINTINAAELYMTANNISDPSQVDYDDLDSYLSDEGVNWTTEPTFTGDAGNLRISGRAQLGDNNDQFMVFNGVTVTEISESDAKLGGTIGGS